MSADVSTRTVGVVTTSRADFGIYRPILHAIERDDRLALRLYVTGMHLEERFGRTVQEVEAEFDVVARLRVLEPGDSPGAIAASMGRATVAFAELLASEQPHVLMVLGDRFEMFAAAAAAVPFGIPIAHIAGGELTEGAIDDVFRHSLTKMSHLHFAQTEEYRRRVIQLGEEPARVFTVGSPSLDNLHQFGPLTRRQLESRIGVTLQPAPLLVTFHPVSRDFGSAEKHVTELLSALRGSQRPIVFTAPNADTKNTSIRRAIEAFVAEQEDAVLVDSLGTKVYFSTMREAWAMVGNSSSGIIEAASFELPVINVGDRQKGRVRGSNVVDVPPEAGAIRRALQTVSRTDFRDSLRGIENPYGTGVAADAIVRVLSSVSLNDLRQKHFYDLPTED